MPLKDDFTNYVKAYDVFKENLQLRIDQAEEVVVDLAFDVTNGRRVVTFDQDEPVSLSDLLIDKVGTLYFEALKGARSARFTMEHADLIAVTHINPRTGSMDRATFADHVEAALTFAFNEMPEIDSVKALEQALFDRDYREACQDTDGYMKEQVVASKRANAYSKLLKFGRY